MSSSKPLFLFPLLFQLFWTFDARAISQLSIQDDSAALIGKIHLHQQAKSKGEISQDSLARFYMELARLSFSSFDFIQARHFIDSALHVEGISDFIIAENNVLSAQIAMEEDDVPQALELLMSALEVYGMNGDSLKYAFVLRKIGNNYDYIGDHEKASVYYNECVAMAQELGQKGMEAACYNNIGGMYSEDGNQEIGLSYYLEGVMLAEQTDNWELIHKLYHGTALTYQRLGNIQESIKYLKKSELIAHEYNDLKLLGFTLQGYGFHYLGAEKYDSSEYFMNQTLELARSIGNVQLQTNALEVLEEVYYKTGRYRDAYEISRLNTALDDSLYNVENARIIESINGKYQAEKRERELAEKNLQLKAVGYDLDRQRAWQTGLVILVVFLIIISFLIYRGYTLRKRAHDILVTKNKEIQLHAEQIDNLNKTKSRWFVNVAHELRTPLTLIKGPINRVMTEYDFPKQVKDDLLLVERNANNLSNLVNEILDLSKMEEGKVVLKESVFNLCRLASQLCQSLESRGVQLGISIFYKYTHDIYVLADEDKVQKVVINLLENAMKYTPKGGKIEVLINADDSVQLTVKDTGKGISPADIPFVFDRFFQSSVNSVETGGGTGVGLALSKEIAELHHGELLVSSQLGVGSAFTFSLPSFRLADRSDLVDDSAEAVKSEISALKKPELLLVEDNLDMRQYVASLLDKYFEIVTAIDGNEALDKLKVHNIRFIISDVMMAGMDGMSLLKNVKADPLLNHLPFIHLSALADDQIRKEALRVGIDDYLMKPFDAEELIIRVKNLYDNFLNRSAMDVSSEKASYDDKVIKKMREEVLANIDDSHFNVLRMASAAAMSERQLYRYLKSATGLTPLQFMQEIKLNKAMELAKTKSFNSLGELASAVGFKQASYFSSLFEKRFGKKPTAWMK